MNKAIRENYNVKHDTTRNVISSRCHDAHQLLKLQVRQRGHELCQLQEYACGWANYHHMPQWKITWSFLVLIKFRLAWYINTTSWIDWLMFINRIFCSIHDTRTQLQTIKHFGETNVTHIDQITDGLIATRKREVMDRKLLVCKPPKVLCSSMLITGCYECLVTCSRSGRGWPVTRWFCSILSNISSNSWCNQNKQS